VSGVPQELDHSPFVTTLFGGALTVHPSGNFLFDGASGVHVLALDATTFGVLELNDSPRAGARSDNAAADIGVDPLGQFLYASDNTNGKVTAYRVDATTGAFGPVEMSPFDVQPMPYSVVVDPTGRFVYVGNDDVNEVWAFSLDRVTGKLDKVGAPVPANGLQPEMVVIGP
jgi:6-phosphogluconolactonase (cycloisomerase 2 family)